MNTLNKSNAKFQMALVQRAIKDTLKVDAGLQSAYHILAVANFFKNDQEMKAHLAKNHYSLSANLGTKEKPFFVHHELGLFDNDLTAISASDDIILNCQQGLEWTFCKNKKESQLKIYSFNHPVQGLTLQIKANEHTLGGLREVLKNISKDIESGAWAGRTADGTMRYDFHIEGQEYFPSHNSYAIFDDNGIIMSDNSKDKVLDLWEQRDERSGFWRDGWDGELVMGANIDLEQALQQDNSYYYAISRDNKTIYSGKIKNIINIVKVQEKEFYLYQEQHKSPPL